MTAPIRIQRSRAKGWRMPEGAIYVGRPSIFGNYQSGGIWDDDESPFGAYPTWRHCVVDHYRRWLTGDPVFVAWWRGTLSGGMSQMTCDKSLIEVRERLAELRGYDLACWCPLDGLPCHADVLLELANR